MLLLVAALDAEREVPDGSYGYHFPVTMTGRLVGGALMPCGIALLGVGTATLASWMLARIRGIEQHSAVAPRQDIEGLTNEVPPKLPLHL